MFKPKTPISAISASPNRGRERDGRLENSSGEWIPHPFFDAGKWKIGSWWCVTDSFY
jgi:hypothetical protein